SLSGSSGTVTTKVFWPDQNESWLKKNADLYLRDDTGATVSYVKVGSTSKGESWSRYRVQGSDEPHGSSATTGDWYQEDTPTPEAKNDEIPEFSDIIYPLVGTLAVYAVMRRRGTGRSRGEETAPAPS
ncbi:MAG: hypothetical protein GWN18_06425, partial [Thermoplasmata archaeon]|nr:hypothetical protein [Thermoplasmata archaeon]NIS11706.1 hypothetical protein [Thermoplasmata archaeon]NIS19605.1 hypothetical protein [Thermoplasmata archaeon]NIT76763.1 hypothetical protein [Thermoplasmata archaeon]NIU48717.1 hypothetical protein [Thermoplasmata archaeon]